ncbi:two-component regulator propeller domain-containing protein [soil metagenome]
MHCGKLKFLSTSIFFVLSLFFSENGKAQNLPIGGWRMHLPYQECNFVAGSNDAMWAATDKGLFRLNRADNAIERISKIEGLSDLSITAICYNAGNDILLVGYDNGNIDLINGKTIINLPDIKRAQIIGNKSINNIFFLGNLAYLSTGFGIVVIDTERKEVKDTYLIGPNGTYLGINDIVIDATTIYAATASGIYYAPVNDPYLSNYVTWTKFNNLPAGHSNNAFNTIIIYRNKLIANYNTGLFQQDIVYYYDLSTMAWSTLNGFGANSVHDLFVSNNRLYLSDVYNVFFMDSTLADPNPLGQFYYPYNIVTGPATPSGPKQIFVDAGGTLWFADNIYGLVKMTSSGVGESFYPNGPISTEAYFMAQSEGKLLVVPGGHDDAWNNVYNRHGISTLTEGTWTNYSKVELPQIDSVYDFVSAAIDPLNPNHFWLGSWGKGLMEVNNNSFVQLWNDGNSSLESQVEYPWVGIGGLQYDTTGNLWIVNSHALRTLQVIKPNGTWQAFDFTGVLPIGTTVSQLLITSTGQKWMILPRSAGMLVFDDNGTLSNTSDDKKKRLGFTAGVGNIPGTDVFSMAEDQDGEIWIGTDQGIGVFYCAENIFSSGGCDAQQILITQDSHVQILLETQAITAIAVDGANRKWIGTEGGGVFLMSADGQTELQHFTKDNSPLLSDDITSLTINQKTGEVFFGTSEGIVSYMGEAIAGEDVMGDVYAFPNPVTHDYTGTIAITGLVKNADVKITDIRGQVVFKTTALGGRAIWDGNNFQGERAASGVYMVFVTNDDGSQKAVTKILLIN